MTDLSTLQKIRVWLAGLGVPFREVQHEPTLTSEASAAARGEELRTGGKALLLKGKDEFALFVMPADRKLDSGKIRDRLGWKKSRFATSQELLDLTGLVPGSVPPFGEPILPFPLYVDAAIQTNEKIAFNAGSLTDSMILQREDYLRIARPVELFSFSQAGESD